MGKLMSTIGFIFWLIIFVALVGGLLTFGYLSEGPLYMLALGVAIAFVCWVATRDYMGTGR